ncbi:DUF2236 domain-containing protein [Nocardioides humilatus]|uniref:DUF2236 domain-containing protein n=1 Tax=Nocardioides humilatus TaxID=2607660 RepID=A0A5B1LGH9_9ACTN|nr:oxygenase MpaB family protein [Nocardioides humilatus]KAA1419308.1 DUF2236 domain-containing protein [Nocardioides humilatus]
MSALPLEPVSGLEKVDEIDLRDYWDGPAAFVAGPANVALQMLGAPGVAYGVMESKVESGRVDLHPFKRARTTLTYLAVSALGTDEDRALYREAVNGAHRHIRSTEDSPVKYNAFDRDLQLWVAACLYYGFADTYERLHGPMEEELAEAIYQQLAIFGTTLQMPRDLWPATRADFKDFFQSRLANADIDDATKAYCRMLIRFEMTPRWIRPATLPLTFMNTGYTPWQLRERLDLPWSPRHQAVFNTVNRATGMVGRRVPRALRNAPFNVLLWDVRRRARTGRPLV